MVSAAEGRSPESVSASSTSSTIAASSSLSPGCKVRSMGSTHLPRWRSCASKPFSIVDFPTPCGPLITMNAGACIARGPGMSRKALTSCCWARTGIRIPNTSSVMACPASSTACVSVLSGRNLVGTLLRTNSRSHSTPMPDVTSFIMLSQIAHLPRGSACIIARDRPAWPLAGRPHGGAAGHLGPGQATNIFA